MGSVGRLLMAKSRSTSGASYLLAYMGGCLFVKCVCPVHLVDESVNFPCPLTIELIVALPTFFLGVVSMVLVLLEFRAGWKYIFCIPGFENVSPAMGQTG